MENWLWLRALLALMLVIALMGLCALLARWWQQKQPQLFQTPAAKRLKILETINIDPRHKLVLVQYDSATQLLLLGPTQSMVVPPGQTVSPNISDS